MKKRTSSIPPPWFVRVVGGAILGFDLLLMTLAVLNYEVLGWSAYVIFFSALITVYFPIKAIQTGNPEWVLLDIMFPV
jgi:hypothetical protein